MKRRIVGQRSFDVPLSLANGSSMVRPHFNEAAEDHTLTKPLNMIASAAVIEFEAGDRRGQVARQ
jgi:hypothetical protein